MNARASSSYKAVHFHPTFLGTLSVQGAIPLLGLEVFLLIPSSKWMRARAAWTTPAFIHSEEYIGIISSNPKSNHS